MAEPQQLCITSCICVKLNVSDIQTDVIRQHHKPIGLARQRLKQMQHIQPKVHICIFA